MNGNGILLSHLSSSQMAAVSEFQLTWLSDWKNFFFCAFDVWEQFNKKPSCRS